MTPTGAVGFYWDAIDLSDDGEVIVVAENGGNVYISSDAGSTWTMTQPGGTTDDWRSVAIDSDGSHIIIGSESSNLYTSTDYGVTWIAETVGAGYIRAVATDADGSVMAAADGNGDVHVSSDAGVTWGGPYSYTTISPSGGYWESLDMNSDGSLIVLADDGEGIFISTNLGADWSFSVGSNAYGGEIALDDDGSHMLAAGYFGGLAYSSNSGTSWTEVTSLGDSGTVGWYAVAIDADGSHMLAAANDGRLYSSDDSGATWMEEQPAGASNQDWYEVALDSDASMAVAGSSPETGANRLFIGAINIVAVDSEPPTISGVSPSGSLAAGTTEVILTVTTSEDATCKYSTTALADFGTKTEFTTTDTTSHETAISGLAAGDYSFYVTCSDSSNNLSTETEISFTIAAPDPVPAGGSSSSSGSLTIEARVHRLIVSGKIMEAIMLMRQHPDKYPYMVETSTSVETNDNPALMSVAAPRDLEEGMEGTDVRNLQKLLNSLGFTVATTGAGSIGNETEFFGSLTRSALAKYQAAHAITPAAGYFGPITRSKMKVLNHAGLWW